jgi:hypothetical protein
VTLPSLSDRFFLPLAILAAAVFVWLALQLRPIGQNPVVIGDLYVMEGAALAQLISGPGTQSAFDPASPGGPTARTTATASLDTGGRLSAGVAAVVAGAFEEAVIGETIEVSLELRAVDPEQTSVGIGYFVVGYGDTGWRMVPVSPRFERVTLRHTVPEEAPRGNNDWVGLWPDPDGAGRTVIVRRIEVRILSEGEAA